MILNRNAQLFLLLCLIWGTTWIAVKIGIQTVPPMLLAGSRFTVAGLVLGGVLAARGGLHWPARADWARLGAATLLMMTLCYALLFWGMQYVASGLAGVLEMALTPIALLGFALLLGDEGFSLGRAASILLGVAGIVILSLPTIVIGTDRDMLLGAAAVAAAAIVYALGAVLSRPLMARYSNIYLSAFTMTFGGGLLLAAALATGPGLGQVLTTPWGWPAFGAWLFLVLFGSLLGYTIYIHLLREWGSSRSGSFAFLSSAIAVVAGHLVFHEPVTMISLAGMAILLFAAWLAMRPTKAA